MNKLIKIFCFFLIVASSISSCTSVSEDDLLEPVVLPQQITYTDNVKPIITANCITCHNSSPGAFGPFPLETYDQVRDEAQNEDLLVRIQLPDGDPSIMPATGKMPQNTIDIILAWANDGFPE
jgi:hypothetical protein